MKERMKKIMVISAAAYVALVILAAVVIGVVSGGRLVLSHHTARVDKEMYAYFQAQQRYQYLVQNGGQDLPVFWKNFADEGVTHDTAAGDYADTYVEAVATSAYLFDAAGLTLTESQLEAAENGVKDVITYRFDGVRAAYDEAAAVYGFDYDAAVRAETLVQKHLALMNSVLADDVQRNAYFAANYVRVKMACIAVASEGYAETAEMFRRELAVENTAEDLAAGRDGFTDAVASMLNADAELRVHTDGYYFGRGESFTESLAEVLPDVVEAVFAIPEEGDGIEVTVDVVNEEAGTSERRTYFIRRYPPDSFAYEESENSDYFADFATNANREYFSKWCTENMKDVVWKDKNRVAFPLDKERESLYKFF